MPTDAQGNNKRIAKNTLLLYVRLFFTMGVGLFTSRVVLNTLGVESYGVYNVVGGIVVMFSFITGSLSAAISRFITYELGKGNIDQLRIVFSTSVNIQLAMALIIAVLAEAIGVWFLNTQMNIPPDRMVAANWVIHFSIFTFVVNLISVPYNASIIAHEKMSAFAYISILEAILKLLVAYSLYVSPVDKLKTYAVLMAIVAIIIRLVYGAYCKFNFNECRYKFVCDRSLLRKMTGFAGWNLLGTGAYLFNTQGVNIVTNIYFGVAVNAARGLATHMESVVRQFVTNFTTAINPQIIKSYSIGELEYMYSLICRGAKFSYLLMLLFVVPFEFETETIMTIWLKTYPPEAALFLRLSMIGTLFDILSNSSANAVWATGNVKKYFIVVGGVGCTVFFLSWAAFALGCPAYVSYIAFMLIYFILIIVKLYIVRWLIGFPVSMYYKEVALKVLPVTLFSFILPASIYFVMSETLYRTGIVIVASLISVAISSYIIGLTPSERKRVNIYVMNKLNKMKYIYDI